MKTPLLSGRTTSKPGLCSKDDVSEGDMTVRGGGGGSRGAGVSAFSVPPFFSCTFQAGSSSPSPPHGSPCLLRADLQSRARPISPTLAGGLISEPQFLPLSSGLMPPSSHPVGDAVKLWKYRKPGVAQH